MIDAPRHRVKQVPRFGRELSPVLLPSGKLALPLSSARRKQQQRITSRKVKNGLMKDSFGQGVARLFETTARVDSLMLRERDLILIGF